MLLNLQGLRLNEIFHPWVSFINPWKTVRNKDLWVCGRRLEILKSGLKLLNLVLERKKHAFTLSVLWLMDYMRIPSFSLLLFTMFLRFPISHKCILTFCFKSYNLKLNISAVAEFWKCLHVDFLDEVLLKADLVRFEQVVNAKLDKVFYWLVLVGKGEDELCAINIFLKEQVEASVDSLLNAELDILKMFPHLGKDLEVTLDSSSLL